MLDSFHASRWQFVGREAELDRVRALREEGALPGVVLHGAPGVGKSRPKIRRAGRAISGERPMRARRARLSVAG